MRLPISAAVLPQGADAVLPTISRIRAVARVVPSGIVLGSVVLDVSPGAESWSVEIPVDLGSLPSATVEVTFELISVSPSGQETVEFAGKTEPTLVRAGSDNAPVTLPLVRGGLGNLRVTSVVITEPLASVLEGASTTLAATVTTSDPALVGTVFWSSLDPQAVVVGNTATGILPGNARIVATAGSKADTALLTVRARPASVRVTPDSQTVVGVGVVGTLTASVLDARGAPIAGQPVLWRSLTPTVIEDQGAGRFRSAALGRGIAEARAVADTTLKGSAIVRVTRPATDVAVTKTASSGTAFEGDVVTFTITAVNRGEIVASGVRVTDELPSGLTLASTTPSVGTFTNGAWSVGDLAAGASATLQLRATVGAGTIGSTLTNTARLQPLADQPDRDPANDVATAPVSIARRTADLALAKSAAVTILAEGDTARFTITVTNQGPFAAAGVMVVDSLPIGLAYLSHSNSRGTFETSSRTWSLGEVAVGATETLVLRALVGGGLNGTTVENRARITGMTGGTDPNPGNDAASASIRVTNTPTADIEVQKTSNRTNAAPGDTVQFTVKVKNTGGVTATNIVVQDTLGPKFRLVAVTTSPGLVADTVARQLRVAALGSGASVTAIYTVVIDNAAPSATYTNTARRTASQPSDPNAANDVASASVVVGPPPPPKVDLALTKTAFPTAVEEQDTVTFTVTVRNNGPVTATNVQVRDTLPTGLTFVSATMNVGDYAGGTWSIFSIPAGETDTLRIRASLNTGTGGSTRTNLARRIATFETDTVAANDTASASVVVNAPGVGPFNRTFWTVGNTQLIAKAYAQPGTPFLRDTANALTGSSGLEVTDSVLTTSLGGTVLLEADGDFTYFPQFGVAGVTDSIWFYTRNALEQESSARLDFRIDTTTVWYVHNDAPAPPQNAPELVGQSWNPFVDLPDARSWSSNGDVIFLKAGTSNRYLGYRLRDDQSLIGGAAGLTASVNGVLTQIVPPGARPWIEETDGTGVTMDPNTTIRGIGIVNTWSGLYAVDMAGDVTIDDVEIDGSYKALELDYTDGTYVISGLRVTGSAEAGVDLSNASGDISFSDLNIVHSGYGAALSIWGGDAVIEVNLNGDTIRSDVGKPLEIGFTDPGSLDIIGGTILGLGSDGITVVNAGPVTIGSAIHLSNTSATAFEMSSSSSVELTGLLDINSAATGESGLEATGLGNLEITGSANTIATGSGTAIQIMATTIGLDGVTFQSVSSNGAPHGIVLSGTTNDVNGVFTVTGTGTDAGSGGTIQASDQAGIFLDIVAGVDLRNMVIKDGSSEAILGYQVRDLAITNTLLTDNALYYGGDAIYLQEITGTSSLTDVTIANPAGTAIDVYNGTGNLDLAISGLDADGTSEYDIFAFYVDADATATLMVDNSIFHDNHYSDALHAEAYDLANLDLTITNSQFSNVGDGIDLYHSGDGNLTYEFTGNEFDTVDGTSVAISGDISAGMNSGLLDGNSYVNMPAGSEGINIDIFGAQGATIAIQNEAMGTAAVPSGLWKGIQTWVSGSVELSLTVANNTIALDPNTAEGNYALYVDQLSDLTPSTICLNLRDNDIQAASYPLWVAQRDPGVF